MSDRSKKRTSYIPGENVDVKPKHSKLMRSGKWTPEEESFANRLVLEFERGTLGDCDEGCTLRSYLAKKLNCAPMRISKKFAGRCIGKVLRNIPSCYRIVSTSILYFLACFFKKASKR